MIDNLLPFRTPPENGGVCFLNSLIGSEMLLTDFSGEAGSFLAGRRYIVEDSSKPSADG